MAIISWAKWSRDECRERVSMNVELDQVVMFALKRAERIDKELWKLLDGLDLMNSDRHRLAAGAFMVAMDVHASIFVLIKRGNHPSAFVLSRSIWEATIRGYWLLKCATDEQLESFINDKSDRKTWHMIRELEQSGGFTADTLSSIHSSNWKKLNAMNHVGGPLVVRCNSERGIENNFEVPEILECLGHASSNALLAAVGLTQAANKFELGKAIFDLQADAFGN